MNVRLTKEQKIKILNSSDIYCIMQDILLRENKIRRNQEHFWIVGLNNANKVLFIELISLGAVNRLQVNPPEMFRMAIYKLAVKAVLVHNHPSGELPPSKADVDFTDRMYKAGKFLKIDVLDHLIISDVDFYSFQDEGRMDSIKNSGLYEMIEGNLKEMQALKLKMEKQKAMLEVAKKMKGEGLDIELIQKVTGLTKKEIKGA